MKHLYLSSKLIFQSAIILMLLLPAWQQAYSQGTGGISINAAGTPPDSSALLDLNSTAKGLLVPRMSTGERNAISNPASSLFIYNTTTNCFEAYGFGQWQTISCLCGSTPSAPGNITGDTSACVSSSLTYSIAPVSGAILYTWAVPSGSVITGGQGTTTVTVFMGDTSGAISVSASNNCGNSVASTLAVTVNLPPQTPGSISGNSNPCPPSEVTYSILPVAGATTYTWTVPGGDTISSGQGTTSINVIFDSVPGNISVTSGNTCGTSAASTLPITINTAPATPGAVGGQTNANNGDELGYYISPVNNASTYTWTVPPGTNITAGLGSPDIIVIFGPDSGSVCVTAGNVCGTSDSSCVHVSNCNSTGSQIFYYTGGLQSFTVPNCANSITITAYGASGGGGNAAYGGLGASIQGTFAVTPGQVLNVVVGQEGYNNVGGSGGGGGSGVTYAGAPLIVAGGGGGIDDGTDANANGTTSNNGNNGDNGTAGGTGGGNGGNVNYSGKSNAYGGNGINDGMNGSTGTNGNTTTSTTIADGSFGLGGGGGGVGNSYCNCGGGGGGYSGGGAGNINANGGGGGSYNSGTNQSNTSGANEGNGQVVITW